MAVHDFAYVIFPRVPQPPPLSTRLPSTPRFCAPPLIYHPCQGRATAAAPGGDGGDGGSSVGGGMNGDDVTSVVAAPKKRGKKKGGKRARLGQRGLENEKRK